VSALTVAAPEAGVPVTGPRRTLLVLRIVAVVHAFFVVLQPMLAGIYLSGDVDAIDVHAINADIVGGLGVLQLIAAIVFVWKGKGRSWALWGALGIVLAEQAQIPLGLLGLVAIHLPLGVSIVSMQILLTVWLCRAAAATPRQVRA
jgi:hypothetical protein